MKKFLYLAAFALIAATVAAPSYGQTSVPDAPDIGVEVLCTPTAQMEIMCSPVMVEYHTLTSCSSANQDIPNTAGNALCTWSPIVRMPMLNPEDAPMPLPLYGMRLWRPLVMNESAKNNNTAAMGMLLPYNIRNALFLSASRPASDNTAINL